MKVSIIVPVFNVSNYLSQCLDSIINQTYQNIEIILVDDGSSDDSGKICDEFKEKDQRIIVIHQENIGVSNSRNNAIKLASGDYITFIDSDDLLDYEYVERLILKANKDTFSLGKIATFKDKIIKNISCGEDIELLKDNFIELSRMYLLNSPCCRLYNTEIIRKNNIFFNSDLSLGEDLLFNLEYLNYVDKIYITNRELYYYRRISNDTLSFKYNSKMKEIQILLFDKYTNFFEKYLKDDFGYTIFDSYRFAFITLIVQNEFRNKKISFLKRYINCRKVISSHEINERLKKIIFPRNKMDYYLISHGLILIYKIKRKIKTLQGK